MMLLSMFTRILQESEDVWVRYGTLKSLVGIWVLRAQGPHKALWHGAALPEISPHKVCVKKITHTIPSLLSQRCVSAAALLTTRRPGGSAATGLLPASRPHSVRLSWSGKLKVLKLQYNTKKHPAVLFAILPTTCLGPVFATQAN